MRYLVTATAVWFSALTACHAQYDFGPPVDYHALNSEFTQQWTSASPDYPNESDAGVSDFAADEAFFVPPQADPSAFSFRPDKGIRRDVTRQMVESVRRENAAGAEEFARINVFRLLRGPLRGYGLTADNLADSLTLYATEVFQSGRRVETEISKKQAQRVRRQMAVALDAVSRSPEAMQRASDKLVLQAFLVYSERTNCVADPEADCGDYWDAIDEQAIALFGVPANQVTLTDDGFAIGSGEKRPGGQSGSQSVPAAGGESHGACGKPYANDAQKREQEIYAKYGNCSQLRSG